MILCVCPNPSIDTYAWLDGFALGASNRISKMQSHAGGKAVHVAMALKELGVNVGLSAIWAGPNGQWLKEQCRNKGISISGIDIEGSNRKCYTFRSDDNSFNNSELLEPGPECSESDWNHFLKNFENDVEQADLVCVSGSVPSGVSDGAYREMIAICNAHNKKVIVDCSGRQLKNALKSRFHALHINEKELEELSGNRALTDLIEALKKNIDYLALTKGKDGLELHHPKGTIFANVILNEVISTVGSGDCLTAGLAYAIYNKLPLPEMAVYATACGAANCLYEDLGQLKKSDVERLVPQIKIETANEVC